MSAHDQYSTSCALKASSADLIFTRKNTWTASGKLCGSSERTEHYVFMEVRPFAFTLKHLHNLQRELKFQFTLEPSSLEL